MKATLDFTPAFCPNCGQPLGLAGWAFDDYQAGNLITCPCGAELVKAHPDNIIMPLGVLAGKSVPLVLGLQNLASEILGHAADLEEQAEQASRQPGAYSQSPETMRARAADLRRYGWALWLIWLQLDPQAQETQEELSKPERAAQLAALAQEYKLILPSSLGSDPGSEAAQ